MACDHLLAKIDEVEKLLDEEKAKNKSLIARLDAVLNIATQNFDQFLYPILSMYLPIENFPNMTDKEPPERAQIWFDYIDRAIDYYIENDGTLFALTFSSLLKTFPTPPLQLQMLLDNGFEFAPQDVFGSLFLTIKEGKVIRIEVITEDGFNHQYILNIQEMIINFTYIVNEVVKIQKNGDLLFISPFVGVVLINHVEFDHLYLGCGPNFSIAIPVLKSKIVSLKISSDDAQVNDAKYMMYFDYPMAGTYSILYDRYIAAQNY